LDCLAKHYANLDRMANYDANREVVTQERTPAPDEFPEVTG